MARRNLPARGLPFEREHEVYADLTYAIPDVMEFVYSDRYLDRPNIYPRQATLLKTIFLQEEAFTEYDYEVLGEWSRSYLHTADEKGEGNNGIVPDILDRIKANRTCPCGHDKSYHAGIRKVNPETLASEQSCIYKDCTCHTYRGRRWFREVVSVIGRRGSKGHVGALAGAYILHHYIEKGDPQRYYGVDRDKRMTGIVFGGKKEQAKANQWRDLNNVILGAPVFQWLISRPQAESLTIYSKMDLKRLRNRAEAGIRMDQQDSATFEIVPRESTVIAGRGIAGFMQFYDEAAHVVKGVANVPAEEVYEAATPALDQFGQDGFIYIPSSPWQKIGLFYDKYTQAIETDEDTGGPVYPEMMMIQLTSWDIYKDWEKTNDPALEMRISPDGPRFMPLASAIQTYDRQMQQLERANPETFKVERRCLDPSTRVLTADLTWRPIGELQPGDKLVALDEEANNGKARRMRTAQVVATARSWDKAYRLTFEDGTSVVCSGNHRWFSSSGSRPGKHGNIAFRWRSLYADPDTPGPRQSLKEGDLIRFLMEPWETDESWGAGYLAGVYDGEGTVWAKERSGSWLSFPQHREKNGDVLDLTLSLLKERGFDPIEGFGRGENETWRINGFDQVARFVGMIGGAKMRRQAIPRLWEGRGLPKMDGSAGVKKIVKIEELPEQELVDIETTTGTFIAEGLVSHNSHFAAVMDAYLNPDRIAEIWRPWPDENGPALMMQSKGSMAKSYRAHGDPSKSGANFGFAIAHIEGHDERGLPHVVFDLIHNWDPADFPDHQIDYDTIAEQIEEWIAGFLPTELTFDQFNSVSTIQRLQKFARKKKFPKRVDIYERPATHALNWKTYETFKTAMGLGLIHAPFHELANQELTFLQDLGGKVDCPDAGPVQTKDVADCLAIVTYELIGTEMAAFIGEALGELSPRGSGPAGGLNPYQDGDKEEVHEALSSFGRARSTPDFATRQTRR